MAAVGLKERGANWGAFLLLFVSVVINVLLVLEISGKYQQAQPSPEFQWRPVFKSWPGWMPFLRPDMTKADPVKLEAPPTHRGKLSHVLFTMRDTIDDLADFQETLEYWKKYPPCLVDSYPTSIERSEIKLVLYYDTRPSRTALRMVKRALNSLPVDITSCFSGMEIRHAGLQPVTDPTPEAERNQWRDVFETLVTNNAQLEGINHVLVLSSMCRPVQADWLNHVDYQVRPPNEHVWIRGSAFLGYTDILPENLAQLVRLSPSGLYFFGDSSFAHFYLTRVRPWLQENALPIYPDFGDRWASDIAAFIARDTPESAWGAVMHQFRHSNFIADYRGRVVSLAQIHRDSPDTVLVCAALVP